MQSREEEKTCFNHLKNTAKSAVGSAALSVVLYDALCYALHFLVFTTDNITLLKWLAFDVPLDAVQKGIPQGAAVVGALYGATNSLGFFKSSSDSKDAECNPAPSATPAIK